MPFQTKRPRARALAAMLVFAASCPSSFPQENAGREGAARLQAMEPAKPRAARPPAKIRAFRRLPRNRPAAIFAALDSPEKPYAFARFWDGGRRRGGATPVTVAPGQSGARRKGSLSPRRLYPGPYWAKDYEENEPDAGTAMFGPGITKEETEEIPKKVGEHLDADPTFKELRKNFVSWIQFQGKDKIGCAMEPRLKKRTLQQARKWLEGVQDLTAKPFLSSQLEEMDPFGYRTMTASSFLGRCDFAGSSPMLERIYAQIQKNGKDDAPRRALHYPNLVSYYFEVELNSSYLEIYLSGVRHGLLWGHLNRGEALPQKFERPKKDLQRDLEPRILSYEGFVGKGEDFQKLIATDRELLAQMDCLGKKPCSARELGAALLELIREFHRRVPPRSLKVRRDEPLVVPITWRGMHFTLQANNWGADIQLSPFKDGLQGVGNYTITRLSGPDGKEQGSVFVPGLIPYLILSRGFFEGRGTSYRVDPVSLVNLFADSERTRARNIEIGRGFEENLGRRRP